MKLLEGQSKRLEEKAMYRRNRRNRKRYRKPRFNNRKKIKGWLAPSIQHKLDSHIRFVEYLQSILPISKIIIEVAQFDIQKIKNPNIEGKECQEGDQLGYWNLREYILHRDSHTCQLCKKKNLPLQVHHIGYHQGDRTDRPSNLVALCVSCHSPSNHQGILKNLKPKLKTFKDATFMTTIRWKLVNALKAEHTYGYITKNNRIAQGLEKTHYNDAFIIANGKDQKRAKPKYFKQVRRNNRSLEKFYDAKYVDIRTSKKASGQELYSGRTTRNKNHNTENLHKYRGEKLSKGGRSIRKARYFYQPNDLVKYQGQIYVVKGSQNLGKYVALKGLKKVINTAELTPCMFSKGICIANSSPSNLLV